MSSRPDPLGAECRGMAATSLTRGPTISDFKRAILAVHGVGSHIIAGERVAVNGWEGEVLVFALDAHPTASFCYAWGAEGDVTVALHRPPIDSPVAAILSALSNADTRSAS